MPTLNGRTPFEVLYGTKPDVTHLCAFSAPCAITKLLEKPKKLDDRATMSSFIGYKYVGMATGFGAQRRRSWWSLKCRFFVDSFKKMLSPNMHLSLHRI